MIPIVKKNYFFYFILAIEKYQVNYSNSETKTRKMNGNIYTNQTHTHIERLIVRISSSSSSKQHLNHENEKFHIMNFITTYLSFVFRDKPEKNKTKTKVISGG